MSDAPPAVPPRPGIMRIAPYVPGEATIAGHDDPAQLAANENALGSGAAARDAYAAGAASLHRYPDGAHRALIDAIAETHGLDPARIVCGAGSDEILALLGKGYADEMQKLQSKGKTGRVRGPININQIFKAMLLLFRYFWAK